MKDLINTIKQNNVTINSSTVSDVMDDYGLHGILSPKLKRLTGSPKMVLGFAYTVDWKPVRKSAEIMKPQPSTWDQVKKFLVPELNDAGGLIYVSGVGGLLTSAALAGGMSGRYFQNLGFEAIILGGATRDANDLSNLTIPVVATNFIPTDTQGSYHVSETGTFTVIDAIRISTGDVIISDLTGTVVIPELYAEEILTKAMKIDCTEADMLSGLTDNLIALIEEKGRI